MNGFHRNPPSSLGEDVLLLIFGYLGGEDLCNSVCQQWRKILKSGTSWRRLFRRQIARSDMWRQAWLSMGLDEMTVPREHFRTICSAIVQYSREMDDNLRTGNFETTDHVIPFNFLNEPLVRCKMEKNYFLFESLNLHGPFTKSISFVDKATMKMTHSFSLPLEAPRESVILLRGDVFILQTWTWIKFYAKNTYRLLHRLEEDTDWVIQRCFLYDELLTVYSNNVKTKTSRLRFWQMENLFSLTYLREIAFHNELPQRLDGDNKFICIYQYVQGFHDESRRLVQFVSTKTLKIERSLSCTALSMKCKGGFFFTWTKDKLVQILDVGTTAAGVEGARLKSARVTEKLRKISRIVCP
jgi:F-box-like